MNTLVGQTGSMFYYKHAILYIDLGSIKYYLLNFVKTLQLYYITAIPFSKFIFQTYLDYLHQYIYNSFLFVAFVLAELGSHRNKFSCSLIFEYIHVVLWNEYTVQKLIKLNIVFSPGKPNTYSST